MSDLYTELLVKSKTSMGMKVLKVIMMIITAIAAVIGLFSMNMIFFLAAVVLGFGYYLVSQNANVEYEYLHVNDEIDVDKIYNRTKRKRVMTIDLKSVEVAAPMGSHSLDSYQQLKVIDFSAKDPNQKPFVLVCKVGDGMKKVVLQLDKKMISNLKTRMPRKVVEY